MTILVVTPPQPIVTWDRAKAHLREDSDDEKDYVEGLIAAATAWLDGPAGWLGQSLGPQLLEWRLADWPDEDRFHLPFGPLLEVEAVRYVDPHGVEQSWPFPTPLWFENMPAIRGRVGDIRVRYWAGYGRRDPDDTTKWVAEVPAPIIQAILLLVGHWYANRETVVTGTIATSLPLAAEALLSPYRVWR